MPKIRLYIAASVDGFIATPDGRVAWLDRFKADYGYEDFIAEVGTVVLGRKTYVQTKSFGPWPYEGKRAYVLSRTGTNTTHGNAKLVNDVGKLIPRLKMLEDGDVWVVGGGIAQRHFLDAGAVDQLDLFVMPVVLGDGVQLFPGKATFDAMTLVDNQTYADGVVRLTYRPDG
ncbi:MAG: dihydrofolate reductase [Alphaproteobacteria bacterium]|nr:dihydrofolate reductase [Alphaproteobacteria bacterium]